MFETNFSGHNKILGKYDKIRRALLLNAPHHGYEPGFSGDMAITYFSFKARLVESCFGASFLCL